MEHKNNDEIDLLVVYNKFKETVKGWIALVFRGIDFILKKKYLILILIIIGVAFGFFSQKNYKPKQKAIALVRINFDSVDYVYSEIDLINEKVKEKDSIFFISMGLKGDSIEIKELEITPIINLNDILEKYEINDRKLEGLLKNLEFDDDDIKIYETFNSEYKYHKLEFMLSENASEATINNTINYINSNEILEELKVAVINDIEDQINKNIRSIEQIDNVIDTYQTNESLASPSDRIFVVDKNFSIHILFEKKLELQSLNESFNKFLVFSKDIAVIVNKPSIIKEAGGLFKNKMIFYPILLVFIFLFLSYGRYVYIYLRNIANKVNK